MENRDSEGMLWRYSQIRGEEVEGLELRWRGRRFPMSLGGGVDGVLP